MRLATRTLLVIALVILFSTDAARGTWVFAPLRNDAPNVGAPGMSTGGGYRLELAKTRR